MDAAALDEVDLHASEPGDWVSAFAVFKAGTLRTVQGAKPLRSARAASPGLRRAAEAALAVEARGDDDAKGFFCRHFRPFRLTPPDGFLTGYYEPIIEGSRNPQPGFEAPIFARPPDLVTLTPGEAQDFDPSLAAARRRADGRLEPYPDRAAIEETGGTAIVFVRDAVEAFFAQVQGSARVHLRDGRQVRLVYDGRNGLPYTSIGRLLIERGEIAEKDMSLATLKAWLRAAGLKPGERGSEILRKNRSFVFFRIDEALDPALGPIGGAGRPLTALRSIAVDRRFWSYGLPFFIASTIPWRSAAPERFARPLIAEDTGSAIVGRARADLFFGAGDEAGARAGDIRHAAAFTVLLPVGEEPA